MNDYGYFIYEDYPQNITATVAADFQAQDGSQNIIQYDDITARTNYKDWASFEGDGFDFQKPIYLSDPMTKIPYSSIELSNSSGAFNQILNVTISTNDAPSGSGITIKTFNENYTVDITVTDINGTRSKLYSKTDDEYYPMPFDGLQSVVLSFRTVEPYSFLKIAYYRLGSVRVFGEQDWTELPQLNNYYSLDNEELAYDTLDLTIRGNKENINIVEGNKIEYTSTGQKFFISSVKYNNDNTISITAYDDISRLEKDCLGLTRENQSLAPIIEILATSYYDDIDVTIADTLYNNQTFSGTLNGKLSNREALRMLMQGNGITLKRINGSFVFFSPNILQNLNNFSEENIIEVPEVEELEKFGKIHFSKHYYNIDQVSGETEIFNGYLPTGGSFFVQFDEPYKPLKYYYVSRQDPETGEDILIPITPSGQGDFVVTTEATYYISGYNNLTQRIVIVGYSYKTSYYGIDIDVPIDRNHKQNEKKISDCTVMVDAAYNENVFKTYLKYIYSFRYKITLQSLKNANVGELAEIEWDNELYNGWITAKKSNLNGIYEYEVLAKWGGLI